MTGTSLGYSELDGLAFAFERNRHPPAHSRYEPVRLGPFVEMFQLSRAGMLPSCDSTSWLGTGPFQALVQAINGSSRCWDAATGSTGVLHCPEEYSAGAWTGFAISAKRAATTKGLSDRLAAELVAAMSELYSNIFEHSFAHRTGFATYHANSEFFEFSIADRGVGLLGSLKSGGRFKHLTAHDEALRIALAPGNSRFDEPGRGLGFTRLFTGLANRQVTMRFRTGDQALELDGSAASLDKAHIAQKTAIDGFIASISFKHG